MINTDNKDTTRIQLTRKIQQGYSKDTTYTKDTVENVENVSNSIVLRKR